MPMSAVEILRAACCVAGLDREINEREMKMLRDLAEHAGVGQVSLSAMIDRAKTDADFYKDQFRIVRTNAENTMRVLVGVAIADHVLAQEERVILAHFAERLGMTPERFDKYLEAAEKKLAAKRTQH